MAKITLPSYIKTSGGRMEDAVMGTWKGKPFMKHYKKPKDVLTEKQMEVRNAFSSLCEDWRSVEGVILKSWERAVHNQPKLPHNEFIGKNLQHRRKGEPIEFSLKAGEEQVKGFAAAGAAGTVTVTFSALPQGRHLSLFLRKETLPGVESRIVRHDCGADPVSPVTVSSLEQGAAYAVYAVVTDAEFSSAVTVSASVGAIVTV